MSDSPYLAKQKAERRKTRVARLTAAIERAREGQTTTVPFYGDGQLHGEPRPATAEEARIATERVKEYQAALEKEIASEQAERERADRAEAREDRIDTKAEQILSREREDAEQAEAERRVQGARTSDVVYVAKAK
jgi:hypothetical protein